MADLELAQAEADALIAMEKHRANEDRHDFPMAGDSLIVPLLSSDKREQFLLDISRGRIDLLRGKYQNRARQVVVLVRLDFGGRPHRNPDDQELPCHHTSISTERGTATSGRYPSLSIGSAEYRTSTAPWRTSCGSAISHYPRISTEGYSHD